MNQHDLFAQPFAAAIAKHQKAIESAAGMHRPVKTHRRRLIRRVADLLRQELDGGQTWVRGHYRGKS